MDYQFEVLWLDLEAPDEGETPIATRVSREDALILIETRYEHYTKVSLNRWIFYNEAGQPTAQIDINRI